MAGVKILVGDSYGIYIPERFAQIFTSWYLDEEDRNTLLGGPYTEDYWEVWDDVLRYSTFTDSGRVWRLHQDGDLFSYAEDALTDEEKEMFGL